MNPKSLEKLIELFSKFPTIGPRTAARFAFYIAKAPKEDVNDLLKSVIEVRQKIKPCSFCYNLFEGDKDEIFCGICSDLKRNKETVCVVEKESDLLAIEQTKSYKGLYFILNGTLSPVRKQNLKKIRVKELLDRIKNPQNYNLNGKIKEVIIATNFTSEGETTALYIERILKDLDVLTTRLARGLPKGGEIEYIDEETISSAFEGRK